MIDLSSYATIESALFLKWEVPNETPAYLSDYHTDVTIDGNIYTNIGTFLGATAPQSELKASRSQLTISLSGIPTGSVQDILTQEIKGSSVQLFRGFFNASTHALLDLSPSDNPVSQFKGVVTNYAVSDNYDNVAGTATTTISLTCNSIVEVLQKKVSGRRTNQNDFDDNSMDRVQALANSPFNFGAPQ